MPSTEMRAQALAVYPPIRRVVPLYNWTVIVAYVELSTDERRRRSGISIGVYALCSVPKVAKY